MLATFRRRHLQPGPVNSCRLQVASLRESNADYRKFYVHSGTSTLTLRAESKEDRWVWMQALQNRCGSRAAALPAAGVHAGAADAVQGRRTTNKWPSSGAIRAVSLGKQRLQF